MKRERWSETLLTWREKKPQAGEKLSGHFSVQSLSVLAAHISPWVCESQFQARTMWGWGCGEAGSCNLILSNKDNNVIESQSWLKSAFGTSRGSAQASVEHVASSVVGFRCRHTAESNHSAMPKSNRELNICRDICMAVCYLIKCSLLVRFPCGSAVTTGWSLTVLNCLNRNTLSLLLINGSFTLSSSI